MRIDKWLVFARFFKTRTKVLQAIEKRFIYLNGSAIKKQSQILKLEDDILIKNPYEIIRIKVKSFAEKREGYEKAKFLYEKNSSKITDLIKNKNNVIDTVKNSSRPNKKDRRALSKLKNFGNLIN